MRVCNEQSASSLNQSVAYGTGRVPTLPDDILIMIASLLSVGQVLTLGRTSTDVYNAVSMILHRQIILNELRSHSCLTYILRHIRAPKSRFKTYPASVGVRKLSYLVNDAHIVNQDLSLLCEFLQNANWLTHLELDFSTVSHV